MEHDISTITTGGLVFTICLGLLLLTLPRRYALAPLLISGCYMTLGQVLMIGSLHFYLFRIIIFIGLIRIFIKREIFNIKLNSLDKVLIVWVTISTFLYILFSGSYTSFVYRLGTAYNIVGIYMLIRTLILDFDDIVLTVKMLGIIIIPLAVLFVIEMTAGRNFFSIFGGVPEFTGIRDGRLRCQGPFRNPILAGTFGATAMPLFVGLWAYSARNRLIASSAILASTIIVVASSSSGPLLAYGTGMIGLICWVFRFRMRVIRWGIVLMLLALHAYMKAPVWFLISRVGELVGGGGWHRSAIIDAAIQHFNEWWLIGTAYTAHWMPYALDIDPTMIDITNQFIGEGVKGGLLSLCLFILLIVKCFKTIGETARNGANLSLPEEFMIWSLGCALVAHVASFLSVSYFDQIIIFWYLIIAMIAALLEMKSSVWTIYVNDEAKPLPEQALPL